ncbi:hypothetical protein KFK14_00370 [Sphingobium phenoxybenzoativorans]|uniref:Uncharacterized protein n=1 Tax=Sphingobium phenoxybenzoativorans TaxID=1592790 RepID=A0A975K8G9_9SPHN|nr:hypothetical protein [Sphingobium phenoxybenzoativorans]QUT06003.1 hypothetical protein KFK14_00370 [Sphingobium phenoxybenzoativorans]
MSHHPDLTTKEGRKAYKHELRMVAVRPRRVGLLLLGVAMILAALPLSGVHSLLGWSPRFLALGAVALATPFLVAAALLRGRYHKRRLNGEAPHLPR